MPACFGIVCSRMRKRSRSSTKRIVGAAGNSREIETSAVLQKLGEIGNDRRGKSSIPYIFAHLARDNGNESTTAIASAMAHEPSISLGGKEQQRPFNMPFSPSVQDKTHWQKGLGAGDELR
jgi:hypothetical protein